MNNNNNIFINKITIAKVLSGLSSPQSPKNQQIQIYNNNKSLIDDTNILMLDNGKELLSIPIGRFTPGLYLEDNKYISKNQIELNIYKDDQSIDFVVKGVNPTYLIKSKDYNNNKKDKVEIKDILGKELDTNVSYKISNGDVLSFLLPNETTSIQFNIDIINEKHKEEEEIINKNNKPIEDNKKKSDISEINKNNSNSNSNSSSNINKKTNSNNNSSGGGWSDKLLAYCDKPKENDALFFDDEIVIINDKYPKSKYHFLVMPRKHILKHSDLCKEDSLILKYMFEKGNKYIQDHLPKYLNKSFQIGFHAIPSMRQLHMHMISNDFQSDSLKTKEHWNSFTTEFFVPYESFIKLVEENGSVNLNNEHFKKLKENQLTCPICNRVEKNIPSIKKHYFECLNNK